MDHHYDTPEELSKLADPDLEFAEVYIILVHNPQSKSAQHLKKDVNN
jgi:hypothetical protein